MGIASKLTAIGMIALSLAVGFLSFYIFSSLTKEEKKVQLGELTSQLINFILFIWLGKIILNISIFISDPLSILAYPSDSKSFYFAIILIALLLLYKSQRKNMNVLPLFESFTHIFLIGSFVYEFMQFVVEDNSYAFGYLILSSILIGIFFFLQDRLPVEMLLIFIVTIWSIGIIILGLVQPFVTVFGYIMAPWFVALFFGLSVLGLVIKLRKRDT